MLLRFSPADFYWDAGSLSFIVIKQYVSAENKKFKSARPRSKNNMPKIQSQAAGFYLYVPTKSKLQLLDKVPLCRIFGDHSALKN